MATNVYFDDVQVGDALPPWSRKTDFMNWNRYAAVNDEFVYIHMDDEAGRAALKAGEVRSIRGRATLVVEDYWISIDCDSPTYFVAFVERRASGS